MNMKVLQIFAQHYLFSSFFAVYLGIILGILVFLLFPFDFIKAQSDLMICEQAMMPPEIIDAPSQLLAAEEAFTDVDGWIHFYNCTESKLLLSIFPYGENIGTLQEGVVVQSGTTSNYGTEGIDLSAANYITNELWFVANRFWNIQNLAMEVDSLKIRFYINATDFQDLKNSFDDFGIEILDFESLSFFAVTGSGVNAYALNLAQSENEAIIYEHEEVLEERRDWIDGTFDGLFYGEFVVKNIFLGSFSEASGTLGFLFFLPDTPLNISGQILNPHGQAVQEANVFCEVENSASTNAFGNYQCTGLDTGSDYTLRPEKNDQADENVSVLDLNRLWAHLLAMDPLNDPFSILAGDVDHNALISEQDINAIHRIILQKDLAFEHCPSWRFVPADYTFPNPLMPYQPDFPETITLENVLFDIFDQNFTGIKTGDVAFEGDYPNMPLQLVTPAFILSDTTIVCNEAGSLMIDLRVQDFTQLSGFQFSLNWDTTSLEFLSIDIFNLADFNDENINTVQAQNGWINFAWTSLPNQIEGVTLVDGTRIAQLSFQLKNTTSSTMISFSSQAVPIQILRQNWSTVENPILDAALINIGGSNLTPNIVNVEDLLCFGDSNGAIDINVTDGVPPIAFSWSNGAQTEDIENLAGGLYSVTISDANNCPKVLSSIEVNEPAVLATNASMQHPNCEGSGGAIATNMSGGTPPYDFLWSTGSTESSLSNLNMGEYNLSVLDANDCLLEETFNINAGGVLTANVSIQGVSALNVNDGSICITDLLFGTAPFSFQWSTGATTACIDQLALGNYSVTVMDANECVNHFAYEVDCCFVTNVDNITPGLDVRIYPNPFPKGETIVLQFEAAIKNLEVELWTVQGQKLDNYFYKNIKQGEQRSMDTPQNSGVYFLSIKREGIVLWTEKLVSY